MKPKIRSLLYIAFVLLILVNTINYLAIPNPKNWSLDGASREPNFAAKSFLTHQNETVRMNENHIYSAQITVDSNKNIYFIGYTDYYKYGGYGAALVKINQKNNVEWFRLWETLEPDYGYGITIDGSDIYIVGTTQKIYTDDNDVFIAKYDIDGNQIWNVTWGGGEPDYGRKIVLDANNNIYVVGYTEKTENNFDMLILKYSPDGNLVWNKTIGNIQNDYGFDIGLGSDGYLYVVGLSIENENNCGTLWLVKFDTNGNIVWSTTRTDIVLQKNISLCIRNSNIYVAGTTISAGTPQIFLANFDTSGSFLWNVTWNNADSSYGYDVEADKNGDIFVIGSFIDNKEIKPVLIKYNPSGNILWNKTLISSTQGKGRSITIMNNTIFILWDSIISIPIIEERNPDGELLSRNIWSPEIIWIKAWGGNEDESAWGVYIDNDEYIYVTGRTNSYGNGEEDVFLLKIGSEGDIIWENTWGGSSWDRGYGVCTYGDQVYVIGQTGSYSGDPGLLLRYHKNGTYVGYTLFDYSYWDDPQDILPHDNYLYICGATECSTLLIKVDPNGNEINHTIVNLGGCDWESDFIIYNGYIYATGAADIGTSETAKQAYVAKFDLDSLSLQWCKYMGTDSYNDYGNSLVVLNDNIYCVGTSSANEVYRLLFSKHDLDGNQQWWKDIGNPYNYISGRAIRASGNYIDLFGALKVTSTYSKIFDMRYNSSGNLIYLKDMGAFYGIARLQEHNGYLYIVGNSYIFDYGSQATIVKYDKDSDNDFVSDNTEMAYKLDINSIDTDNDGLEDFAELMIYGTNPRNQDTDGDGYSDKEEIDAGTNPLYPENITSSTSSTTMASSYTEVPPIFIYVLGIVVVIIVVVIILLFKKKL